MSRSELETLQRESEARIQRGKERMQALKESLDARAKKGYFPAR